MARDHSASRGSYSAPAMAAVAEAPEMTPRQILTAAFARRAELARQYPFPEEEVAAQDQEIVRLVNTMSLGEKFDPNEEPVMAFLASKPRDVNCVRLMLQPRVQIDLYKPEPPEVLHDAEVTINGTRMMLPRGRAYDVPKDVATILRESKVR